MKVIKEIPKNYLTCTKCGSYLEWEPKDLRWTHTEPDEYYVKCPVCGEILFIKSTPELDEMYNRLHSA